MGLSKQELWERFQQYYTEYPQLGLSLDLSRMNFSADFFSKLGPRLEKALAAMVELEKGSIANPDEKRMVGHYWLRNPALAPSPAIRKEIEHTIKRIKDFASQVHQGKLQGSAGPFKNLLLIGIGGSALGPQFVANALGHPTRDKLTIYFFDNTDPDGIDNTLSNMDKDLGRTLCVIVSKSGGTKETRNGMLEAAAAYQRHGLKFEQHAVAITSANSDLDKYAVQHQWLARFPMWDWVGGRTSELSAVGLVPAALQGLDIDSILAGAKICDDLTRNADVKRNPAAQLAAMWYSAGNGKGAKNLVVLPYKDRLELFSKYLQQLLMESLGKERDLDGNVVHQGITVLGNKGSTDQHSYIQQLRDGLDNFFVIFIRVLKDRSGPSIMVDPEVTSGDYLDGFFQGTRQALFENARQSITITVPEVSATIIGALIALFERTVGIYANLININAYHQPGVEAGKKAASSVIDIQRNALAFLNRDRTKAAKVQEIAKGIQAAEEIETVFLVCEHMAANPDHHIDKIPGPAPSENAYRSKL